MNCMIGFAAGWRPVNLKCVVADLAAGGATERIQDESVATIAKKLSRQDATLDFNQPAEKVARQVRGLYPWPGCRVRLVENTKELGRVTLVRVLPQPDRTSGLPGRIDSDGSVACGTGSVQIVELQPEGKLPMPLPAYRNGHAWSAGSTIESVVK